MSELAALTPVTKKVMFSAPIHSCFTSPVMLNCGSVSNSPSCIAFSAILRPWRDLRVEERSGLDFRCRPFLSTPSSVRTHPSSSSLIKSPTLLYTHLSSLIGAKGLPNHSPILAAAVTHLLSPTSVEVTSREHSTLSFYNHSDLFVSIAKASMTTTSMSSHNFAVITHTDASSAIR